MKHKTFVRLLVKLMGIYFLIGGICGLVASFAHLLIVLPEYSRYGGIYLLAYPVAWGISCIGSIIAGLILLLASNWLVSKLIPSNRPYCPNCGYELTGNTGATCPECGVDLRGLNLTSQPQA